MKRAFKWLFLVVGILGGVWAIAGPIKVWGTTDTLQAIDLNGNFNHIHSTMVGGHGARLVDSDVSPTAAISHSKMATPPLLPKAVVVLGGENIDGGICNGTSDGGNIACLIMMQSPANYFYQVQRQNAGVYYFYFSGPRPNAIYAVLANGSPGGAGTTACVSGGYTQTSFWVQCSAAQDVPQINLIFMDDDN